MATDPAIIAFDNLISNYVNKLTSVGERIGGKVLDVSKITEEAFFAQKDILVKSKQHEKLDNAMLEEFLKALRDLINRAEALTEGNDPEFHLHLMAGHLSLSALSWIENTDKDCSKPVVKVNTGWYFAQTYNDQIVRKYKDKDAKQVEWAKALEELYQTGLKNYVKAHYPLGIACSATGKTTALAASGNSVTAGRTNSSAVPVQVQYEDIRYQGKVIWSPHILPKGIMSWYLSNYKEMGAIGHGSGGAVFVCINKIDGKQYAVKKIPFNVVPYEEIRREVLAHSSMYHPNVVCYYTAWIESCVVGEYGGPLPAYQCPCAYIVMELCSRRTLVDFIANCRKLRNNALDIKKWKMFKHILEGLAHIHEKGFVHRDLSPKNIFLDESDNIKIGDFGLAMKIDDKGNCEDSIPTASIMHQDLLVVPEYGKEVDTRSDSNDSKKIDIFNLGPILGAVLYDCSVEKVLCCKAEGDFPENWPEGPLISKLMATKSCDRPSILDVMEIVQERMTQLMIGDSAEEML